MCGPFHAHLERKTRWLRSTGVGHYACRA